MANYNFLYIALLAAGTAFADPVMISSETTTQQYLAGVAVTGNVTKVIPDSFKVGSEVYKRDDGSCFRIEYFIHQITRVKLDGNTIEIPKGSTVTEDISCPQ